MTLLATKSHLFETRPFSTPTQALTHQLSSGRSTALTGNFCMSPPTSCAFYQRTRHTAPLSVPLPTRVRSKMPKSNYSILRNPSPLSSSSKILQFSPFIGPQGLLRATGRTKKLDVRSTFPLRGRQKNDGDSCLLA